VSYAAAIDSEGCLGREPENWEGLKIRIKRGLNSVRAKSVKLFLNRF